MTGSAPGGLGAPPGGPVVPAPPPGPGVTPPFSTPPVDRNRRGLWIGLGVGALLLVLCCLGGIVGFGLLAVSASRQVQTSAADTVERYLGALRAGDYGKAYTMECAALTRQESLSEFTARERARPIADYQVGRAQVGSEVVVPADVVYVNGFKATREYVLSQQVGSQNMRICGVR